MQICPRVVPDTHLKRGFDKDGKCMADTAFPAIIVFAPSSDRKAIEGGERVRRDSPDAGVACFLDSRLI